MTKFIQNSLSIYRGKVLLLKLYNLSWKHSVPAEWRKAIIVPILMKEKPSNNISNYKPISLTSVIAKVMEKMISTRLT